MKKSTIIILIITGVLLMGACGSNNAGNNAKATPTPMADGGSDIGVSTPTSAPTATVKPTESGLPTATPEPEVANLEGTLPEIIEKIYAQKESGLMVMTMEPDLTDLDALPYYTGLKEATKIKAAAVSESAFGSQAYSLVLVRLNDAKDAEEIANAMLEGIDTRKWCCVQADDVRVAAYGDVIMFIMTSTEFVSGGAASAQDLTDAFSTVCGGELSVNKAK